MTPTRTTKYVTLLSVVLALALTAALVACGSDEPSDVTASMPGSGDAPTATDAPAPATSPPAASGSVETDRKALVALYNATDGENWSSNFDWLSDAPLGEWQGVSTNDDGRVIELYSVYNGLSGELPAELGSLSKLTQLDVTGDGVRLGGEIPAELGSLSNLELLDLSDNDLSGEIPAELGSLSNLRDLSLGNNELSGEIPPELGSLSNLTLLQLPYNALSGEIPPELGGLSKLTQLDLRDNELSGEIPAELGSLSNLTLLRLSGNALSGCVPSSLEDQLDAGSSAQLGGLPFC